MMTCRSLILLCLLTACASNKPRPGDDWNPRSGDHTLQAFARYIYADNEGDDNVEEGEAPTGLDQEALTIDADIGLFVSDSSEVGISLDGLWTNNEIDDSSTSATGLFYNYNIALAGRTTLYFGPQAIWVRIDSGGGSDTIEEIAYGAQAGLRLWYSPAVYFVLEPSYLFTDYDKAVGGAQDQFTFKMGVGLKF